MRIIVTGGCGFIGSHLVNELILQNHDVIVIDNLSADNNIFYFNDSAKYCHIDICKFQEIKSIFHNINHIDYVFHLAAEARIQSSIENPRRTTEINVLGTVNILEACVKYKIKRIIYSSTSAIYGLTEKFPTNEIVGIDCLNPYAASKYAGEEMIRCFTKLHNLDSCIFRYFNVYGENSPITGPHSLVIGRFLDQKKRDQDLTVVGTGDSLRDFVHVQDVINANIRAMNHHESLNGEIFNIGSGENFSILDIAKTISTKIKFIDPRLGEAKTTLADINKARNVLGWTPKINLITWLKTQL